MTLIQLAMLGLMLVFLAFAGQASHDHVSTYAKGYQVEVIGPQWGI